MSTIALTASPDRRSVDPGAPPSRLHVVVELRARGAPVEGERAPIACVLALDVSGSMKGEPLEHLVASVRQLSAIAAPSDHVGVVVFADSAAVVAPPIPMDAHGRRLVQARVSRLVAGGNTNIEDGLRLAAHLLGGAPPDARKAVLLLSDGAPNLGCCTPHALATVARSLRHAVGCSTLGYGPGHQEDVLAAIAGGGGGRYAFVPHPTSCKRELAQALGAQGDVVAEAIELTLVPADGVQICRFFGARDVRFGRGATVSLPDMEDGASAVVAVELALAGPPPPRGELLAARVAYRSSQDRTTGDASAVATVDVKAGPSEPDLAAVRWLYLLYGEEERQRARSLADRGQLQGAAAVLRMLVRAIDALPGAAPDGSPLSELREAALDEAIAYERQPSAESYANFKRHTMVGVVSSGMLRPSQGKTAQLFRNAVAGACGDAHVVLLSGPCVGHRHRLADTNAIGRTPSSDIVLPFEGVSRRHAEIYALEGDFWICDLGSTNPTEVNRAQITVAPRKLSHGDVIRIGPIDLRFEQP
jgi:Ca-activated chloride channel family protein